MIRIFLLLLFLIISGCNQIESGTVINKKHKNAYSFTTFVMSGKVMVPIIHHYPESWIIYIGQGEKKGSCSVSELEFKNIQINSYYNCVGEK
jgi:hypothetical protein